MISINCSHAYAIRVSLSGIIALTITLGILLIRPNTINATGSPARFLDHTFHPTILNGSEPGSIVDIIIQPDGKILICGRFTTVNGLSYKNIVRLKSDGSVDDTFNPVDVNSPSITAMARQDDGRILIAGSFSNVNGVPRNVIARLDSDGSLDGSLGQVFDDSLGQFIFTISPLANGQIIIGGGFAFTYTNPDGTLNGRQGIARLSANGSLDRSFGLNRYTHGSGVIHSTTIQNDGRIVVGGDFPFLVGNNNIKYIGRLNADGTLDTSFGTVVNSSVRTTAMQDDGKIIIGGSFSTVNGVSRRGVARLNNGSLDTFFNTGSGVGGTVKKAKIQPDGKVIIAGGFSSFDGISYTGVARLNTDGSPDISFNPVLIREGSGTVFVDAMDVQNDGKIIIGGTFYLVNEVPQSTLARFIGKTVFDFDGDGRADLSVFRPTEQVWYLLHSNSGFSAASFGVSTDRITPTDFDGDGKTDIAVFRNGNWYWLNSSNGSFNAVQFGKVGDIPVPADYTGDGRAEIAVYRSGVWYTLNLVNNQFQSAQLGNATDKPVPADYDADGKTDYAVYRDGTWYLLRSSQGFTAVQFGNATDKPVVGDYDGDGIADQAVYRAGVWYVLGSTQGYYGVPFGLSSDVPVAADYDGDGKTDLAVFRDGYWYSLRSQQGFTAVQFGATNDRPIPAAYVP